MKKTNRVISVLVALLLVVSVCPVSIASAAGLEEFTLTFNPDLTKTSSVRRESPLTLNSVTETFDFSAIHDYLLEQFENCVDTISLLSFQIPRDQGQALVDYIGNELPEAFHLDYTFTLRATSEYLYDICNITYHYTPEVYAGMLTQFRQNAAWLLRGLTAPALTDVEKALLIHDRIVTWTFYGFCGDETTESPCFRADGPADFTVPGKDGPGRFTASAAARTPVRPATRWKAPCSCTRACAPVTRGFTSICSSRSTLSRSTFRPIP